MALTFTFLKKTKLFRYVLMLLVAFSAWQGTNAQCTWVASTVYPVPVLDQPMVSVGNTLYSFAGVANGAIVASSYKFDGTAWTAIAPMPQALEYPAAVSDGNNVYIMGGANTTGTPVTNLYRYNVATNTYTSLASFTTGVWNPAAVYLNGKIYKFTGTAAAGSTTALEIYDIGTNTWTAGAPYPTAFSFVSGMTDGTFIYGAGGIASTTSLATDKTYRYNPGTNAWDDAGIADLPATRWGAAGGFYNSGFIMAGGYVAGTATANISTSVINWSPVTGNWTSLPNMLGERARVGGAELGGSYYVVGGRSVASAAFIGTNDNQKLTCPPVVCNPVNATAPVVSGPSSTCTGTSATLTVVAGALNGAAQWRWYSGSCGGTLVGVGNSITVTPGATTTYFVRGEGGCAPAPGPCTSQTVTIAPCTCLSPEAATVCSGTLVKLAVSGSGTPGSSSATSGTIAVVVPDANATGITTPLPVSLPPGATITSMTVTINMTHTWDADMVFNLVAPGGGTINLINSRGGSGDNFTNTVITSVAGAPSLATGVAPFTGTWAPDATLGVGPTTNLSNVASFNALFTGISNPSGNWLLAMRDQAGGDIGILTSWTLNFNYVVLPTATWTGGPGTIFSENTGTTPYVAGTQANAVWVRPTATTTYTATIASGPCAGANNVTVTVLQNPVVTVSPTSGCGPLTITASGANFYSWSPGGGLNTTSGPTVIANPSVTTTYTVTGTNANSCQGTATATVNSAPTASVITAISSPVFQIQEGFTVAPPAGWAQKNNSNPLGTTNWFQGNAAVFPAFNGATNSYVAANYQNTDPVGVGDISNWLMTPVLNIKTGDQISFYTRTTAGATFPDRLEVRLSTAGASVNVGSTTTSVGDFTTVLLTINPNLQPGAANYPDTWTRFTATITGIAGTVTGRIGFRYWVTNAGGAAPNSDYIGIDQVEYTSPPAPLCANTVTNIAVNITGGVGPYTVVFSNGTTNTTITNYTSGALIQVSPAVTTTYTIVSVTGANGCVGTGNTGSAVVVITPPPSITTQPVNTSVCSGNNATITVAAGPALGNTYQWQVSTDNGVTYTNVVNGGVYSGATSPSLVITGATVAMNNYRYRVLVNGACAPAVTSNAITLSVNVPAVITTQPVNASVCVSGGLASTTTTFSVVATGGGLTYQWQVSTDGGTTWTNIANGGSYAGATSATLTLSGVPATFTNNRYRVLVTTGGCASVTSASATLTANPNPVIVLSANPYTRLYPGLTTTLTAATSPAGTYTYTWFRNGVVVPNATGNTLVVNVDQLGAYSVIATNSGTTCSSQSSTVNIADSITGNLFIYPVPNRGQFQVRYINPPGTPVVRMINVYDAKGSRVYSRNYNLNAPYNGRLDVDIRNTGRGIYLVELTDGNHNRIKAGYSLVL